MLKSCYTTPLTAPGPSTKIVREPFDSFQPLRWLYGLPLYLLPMKTTRHCDGNRNVIAVDDPEIMLQAGNVVQPRKGRYYLLKSSVAKRIDWKLYYRTVLHGYRVWNVRSGLTDSLINQWSRDNLLWKRGSTIPSHTFGRRMPYMSRLRLSLLFQKPWPCESFQYVLINRFKLRDYSKGIILDSCDPSGVRGCVESYFSQCNETGVIKAPVHVL